MSELTTLDVRPVESAEQNDRGDDLIHCWCISPVCRGQYSVCGIQEDRPYDEEPSPMPESEDACVVCADLWLQPCGKCGA